MPITNQCLKKALTQLGQRSTLVDTDLPNPDHTLAWKRLHWLQLLVHEKNLEKLGYLDRAMPLDYVLLECEKSNPDWGSSTEKIKNYGIEKLKELIVEQQEIILSEYILFYNNKGLNLESIVQKYKNKMYEIALLQIEVIILSEQYNGMSFNDQIQVLKALQLTDLELYKLKLLGTDKVLKKLQNKDKAIPLCDIIPQISLEERDCTLFPDTKDPIVFEDYKGMFNRPYGNYTTFDGFLSKSVEEINKLLVEAGEYLGSLSGLEEKGSVPEKEKINMGAKQLVEVAELYNAVSGLLTKKGSDKDKSDADNDKEAVLQSINCMLLELKPNTEKQIIQARYEDLLQKLKQYPYYRKTILHKYSDTETLLKGALVLVDKIVVQNRRMPDNDLPVDSKTKFFTHNDTLINRVAIMYNSHRKKHGSSSKSDMQVELLYDAYNLLQALKQYGKTNSERITSKHSEIRFLLTAYAAMFSKGRKRTEDLVEEVLTYTATELGNTESAISTAS